MRSFAKQLDVSIGMVKEAFEKGIKQQQSHMKDELKYPTKSSMTKIDMSADEDKSSDVGPLPFTLKLSSLNHSNKLPSMGQNRSPTKE
jgi:hypothetical protein